MPKYVRVLIEANPFMAWLAIHQTVGRPKWSPVLNYFAHASPEQRTTITKYIEEVSRLLTD